MREGRASPHLSPHPHGGQLVYPGPSPGAPFGVLLPHPANGDAGGYAQQWATLMYPANPHVQAALAAAQQAGLPRPALPQGPPASGAPFSWKHASSRVAVWLHDLAVGATR